MKVKDLEFIRDPSMEVYRAKFELGPYHVTISLRKEPNIDYAIIIKKDDMYVNLDEVNPGVVITDFLSEDECNIRLANLEQHVSEL